MKLLPSCREVTHLVLQAQDRPLPRHQRWAMQLHWMMCRGCRNFSRQAQLMQRAMARWRHNDHGHDQGH